MPKKALITGITGQDGSYLAELLLKKKYKIIGITTSTSKKECQNIEHIKNKITLIKADIRDTKVADLVKKYKPDEIYNLAAITFVPGSEKNPKDTLDINTTAVLQILDAIQKFSPKSKFLQASSAEMFGDTKVTPQNEKTPLLPQSFYGITKVTSHQLVQFYRRQFKIKASNVILYNHESIRRPEWFVPRKITKAAAMIKLGKQKKLELGNLEAERDWGYAPDYVKAMHKAIQKADDYTIATGKTHKVKDLCNIAFKTVGLDYKKYVKVNKKFWRPKEKVRRVGSSTKIKSLGWKPSKSFKAMVEEMVRHDLKSVR